MKVIACSLYLRPQGFKKPKHWRRTCAELQIALKKKCLSRQHNTETSSKQLSVMAALDCIWENARSEVRVYIKKKKEIVTQQQNRIAIFKSSSSFHTTRQQNYEYTSTSSLLCLDDPPLYTVKNSGRQRIKARITRKRSLIRATLAIVSPCDHTLIHASSAWYRNDLWLVIAASLSSNNPIQPHHVPAHRTRVALWWDPISSSIAEAADDTTGHVHSTEQLHFLLHFLLLLFELCKKEPMRSLFTSTWLTKATAISFSCVKISVWALLYSWYFFLMIIKYHYSQKFYIIIA